MENSVGMPFTSLPEERYPVGFMDLLGVHQGISRYALMHTPPMHFPTTPNSSSSEALTGEEKNRDHEEEDDDEEEEEEEEEQHRRNKRFKSTESSHQTKSGVPKVSFITKSVVDNLDDGYKWRKYGQKPVKNSPFPRNYYRCTTSWCDVKKRVERSFSDPSSVITTYEGQHTHPGPLITSRRNRFASNGSASGSHFSIPTLPPHFNRLFDYNNQEQQQELSFLGTGCLNKEENGINHNDDHVLNKSRTRDLLDGAGLAKDHGLLQDVVPSHVIKEEY